MFYGMGRIGVANIYGGKFKTGNAAVMGCYSGTINLLGVAVRMINTRSGNPIDTANGTVTGAVLKNVTSSGCDVYFYANNSNVTKVQFPTWTSDNGQDDITREWGTSQGNSVWYYRVNASSHNNETISYNTHIYAYNSSTEIVLADGTLSGYDLK